MFAAKEKAAVNKHAGFHVNMDLLSAGSVLEGVMSGHMVITGLVLQGTCTLSFEAPCAGEAGSSFP